MSTSREILTAAVNLDGKPSRGAAARTRANAAGVADQPGIEQFIGWTEGWLPAAADAVRDAFPLPNRLIRPKKPYGAGMSVMASYLGGSGWSLESTRTVQVSPPLWYRGRFLSDARYLLVARFITPEGRDFLLLIGHHNPDGTWAGAGATRVTTPAREEAVRITRSVLEVGGAPAIWLGDPNLAGAFLGATVRRGPQNTPCLMQYVGGGRVDRAVFIDGTTGRWDKVAGSRVSYAANPGHPMGWLRARGTVTWP